jgi:hypothetical protein
MEFLINLGHENPNATEQEREARLRCRPAEGLVEWLERITPETAAIMNDGRTSKELIDELYDPETGLPI